MLRERRRPRRRSERIPGSRSRGLRLFGLTDHGRRACAVAPLAVWLVSCSGSAPESPPAVELLVDHGAWSLVAEAESDPFAVGRGRPTVHACQDAAYFEPMPGTLEVELAYCRERYVSLHQATLVELRAGDHVSFTLSHLLLRPLTEDVTEAYVALAVDGVVVWDQTIQILAVGNSYSIDAQLSAEFAAGSDVVLHLDNHGENSYTFTPFEVVRAGAN